MEELTGLDARFLYSETPTAPMHTIKVVVVDVSGRTSALTPEAFFEQIAARIDRLPVLRRRALDVPYRLGHPVWIEDPDFDLARHLRWGTVPAPHGERELAAVVAEIAAEPLPRDRPLWTMTVVGELNHGRVAIVIKLHHAMADGGAAVALLQNAFMADDRHAATGVFRPEPIPTRSALIRHALANGMSRAIDLPRLVRQTIRGLRAARRARRDTDTTVSRPFAAPRTSLNASLDADRTYAMTTLSLADLMAVRTELGATLNEVFLSVCGGALREYLARRGELPAAPLVAAVPVATRADRPYLSGNHVDNLMLSIGTNIADPRARTTAIHNAAASTRRVRDALGPEMFEYRASLTSPILYPLGIRLWARTRLADRTRPPVNLIASNVRGPSELPVIDGGSVTALYSVGPILEGIGLNITAWSLGDHLDVSVLGCPTTLPDPWELIDDLAGAAAELTAAAGVGRA